MVEGLMAIGQLMIADDGVDTTVTFGAEDILVIEGVLAAALTSGHFLLN
jgi:hypothetical protein